MANATKDWNKYGITCMEDIIKISDMSTAFKILKEFNLNRKGIKAKGDAIEIIADYWKAQNNQELDGVHEHDFSEAILHDEEMRRVLSQKCAEVETIVGRLPSRNINDLNSVFPDVAEKLRTTRNKLKSAECNILIVGESNSGKSSIINLLLGHDLLPVGCLSTTRNVCEIKPSRDQEKIAIVHRKVNRESRRHAPDILDLSTEEQFQKFQKLVSDYNQDTGETSYDKIEIFWPHRLKQCGLIFTDTPGSGENRSVPGLLQQYASKVSGFIFVLNSSNAGGVQKRVRHLLRAVSSACDREFSHEAAIFVFNKWDTVPEADKISLFDNSLSQLGQLFPGVRQDQILRLSTTEAMEVLKHRELPEGYKLLYSGVCKIIPVCLRNGYNIHYQFLSQVVKRTLYSLKVARYMDSQGIEEKKKMKQNLQQGIEHLEQNTSTAIENLRLQLRNEARLLHLRVRGILSSDWLVEEWEKDECPDVGHWKEVAAESENKIKFRLYKKIDAWEKFERIGKRIGDKIKEQMRQDFEMMEDRMTELEGNLIGGDVKTVKNFYNSIKRPTKSVQDIFSLSSNRRASIDKQSLGSVVCHDNKLNLSSRSVKSLFKSYKQENCQQKMKEAWKIFIETILESDKLDQNVDLFLEKYESSIKTIEQNIPQIIEKDKQLFDNLTSDLSSSTRNVDQLFPQNITDCSRLQGELDMVFVEKIKIEPPDLSEITWRGIDIVGSGSYADVYLCKIQTNDGECTEVAAKVYKSPVSINNVSDILLEDRTLRDLSHKNIIRYYGSVVKRATRKSRCIVEWGLIMEYCPRTLAEVLLDEVFHNPGKVRCSDSDRDRSLQTVAMYAVQICQALAYIHGKCLVHRDLKLANILVNIKNELKLTDVGLTKAEEDITATSAGSPIYMAPEVLRRNVIYDRKADIYSLGIILWEMWFGRDAGHFMKTILTDTVEHSVVEDGVRPPMNIDNPPPDWLEAKIHQCWDNVAENRPDAVELIPFFQSIAEKSS